jgi:hypothetical protein
MKRFAPLALIVLALAAVPAAFADDSAPTAPSNPPATQPANGHPMAHIQLELLRIRLQLVRLRYQIVCHKQDSDKCTQFTQKVTDRLTKLDGNVQDKLSKLNCASTTGTDKRCDVLTKLDQKLQDVIAKLGSSPSPSSAPGESGLDNAAGSLAGSTNP